MALGHFFLIHCSEPLSHQRWKILWFQLLHILENSQETVPFFFFFCTYLSNIFLFCSFDHLFSTTEKGRGSCVLVGMLGEMQTEKNSPESHIYPGSTCSQAWSTGISWRQWIVSPWLLSPSIAYIQNKTTSNNLQMSESKWD